MGRSADDAPRRRLFSGRFLTDFAVVVLGVLVALWADAWMSARAERSTERARLEALGANVDTTLADLRSHGAAVEEMAETLRGLVGPHAGPADADQGSSRTAVVVALIGAPGSFHPQLNVYQDLKSSGELSLLNPEVRRWLAALDASLGELAEAGDDFEGVQHRIFDPYTVRNVDMSALLAQYPELGLEPAPEAADRYASLVGRREFRNLVVFKLDLLKNMSSAVDRVEEDLVRVDEAIGRRLGQLR